MARFGTLSTDRLLIRNILPGDAEAFFAYKRMPEATEFQYWRPKSLEDVRVFIKGMETVEVNAPGAWLQLAVCLNDGGEMIGDVGLHFSPEYDDQAEIGYTISPMHQCKGYATEAVRAVLGYLFGSLGKRRIIASVDPRNTPSAAVLEKLGFRKEAHFRKSVYMDGEWQDDIVYAILKEEWKP